MSRTISGPVLTEAQKRAGLDTIAHLVEIEAGDGSRHFWSSFECKPTSILTGAAQQFQPWLIEPYPEFTFTKSVRADAGEFSIQNLSGNLIDRDAQLLIKQREFGHAAFIYRRHYLLAGDDAWRFEGFISQVTDITPAAITFRVLQLFQPNELSAYDGSFTRPCRWPFNSPACGYRRGELLVPLTIADTFSASTIGKVGGGGLGLTVDLYKDEVAMILVGTGAGQERSILSHTADVFTLKTNWTTVPDGTSQFIVTGPGTMLVAATLADIFSATTIGKIGSGWTVDAFKDQLAVPLSGTGSAGDFRTRARRITANTADTLSVSPAFAVTPDGTTRFAVVYRECPKTRQACVDRGVIERFSGIIHANALIEQVSSARPRPSGGGLPPGRRPAEW